MEVCSHHLHTPPERPSVRRGEPVPADLEELVMACLAKSPADRPESARALRRRLADCESFGDWDEEEGLVGFVEELAAVDRRRTRSRAADADHTTRAPRPAAREATLLTIDLGDDWARD